MDINTLISYINNAIYKRDQARKNKELYSTYAYNSDSQAEYHVRQAGEYRSQAEQYEEEELNAQRDVEYYQQQADQTQYESTR